MSIYYRTILSYLMRKADPVYEHGLERERWKPQVVRHKPWDPTGWPRPAPKSLDKFHDEHSATYSRRTLESLEYYSTEGHHFVNNHLRGQGLSKYDLDSDESFEESASVVEDHIDCIDEGMSKSPIKSNVTVWRGLNVGFYKDHESYHPIEKRLMEIGAFKDREVNYQKALSLKGFTFVDPGYVSTTMNPTISRNFTDVWGVPLQLEIKVPVGTQAIYLPGAHSVHSLYNKGWHHKKIDMDNAHRYETELLLDRGLTFKVTDVTVDSPVNRKEFTGFKVTLEVVK